MPLDHVAVRRFLQARRDRVFEAWTRPEWMARWFFPADGWAVTVTADLRIGGRYELSMLDTEGRRHLQHGVYREIVPVSRLVFTWTCAELRVFDSVVTVELIDHGERTELVLTHELPPDPSVQRGHQEGWQGCLEQLHRTLTTDERSPR